MRVALGLLGCAWLCASPVLAEPVVTWQASAGCPGQDEGRAQVERLLRTPLRVLAISLLASVQLERAPRSGFAATIAVRQDGLAHTRVLHSADCSVVANAAALVVALAIDPNVGVDGSGSAMPEPPTPAAEAERPSALVAGSVASAAAASGQAGTTRAEARAAPAARAARAVSPNRPAVHLPRAVDVGEGSAADGGGPSGARLQPVLGLGSALAAGILPRPGPAFALSAGFETAWLRAAVRLSYAPAQRATLVEPAALGGSVGLSFAALEAGPRARVAWLELSGLAGLEAGVFDARGGEGLSSRQTTRPLWLGAHLGVAAALAASAAFCVGLRFEGVVALRRPSFTLEDDLGAAYALHRPGLVSGRGWIELELRFAR